MLPQPLKKKRRRRTERDGKGNDHHFSSFDFFLGSAVNIAKVIAFIPVLLVLLVVVAVVAVVVVVVVAVAVVVVVVVAAAAVMIMHSCQNNGYPQYRNSHVPLRSCVCRFFSLSWGSESPRWRPICGTGSIASKRGASYQKCVHYILHTILCYAMLYHSSMLYYNLISSTILCQIIMY